MLLASKSTIIHIDNKNWVIFFFLIYVLPGCNTDNDEKTMVFTEHTVEKVQVFLSVENAPFLGRPTAIHAVTDGLFLVDEGHYQITKVDREGNQVLSFGNRGRGAGEFQSIAGFWAFKNEYLVYDYNSFKFLIFNDFGELMDEEILKENPVNPHSEQSIPITLDAISSDKLLIPTGGRHGYLFAIADRSNSRVTYAGIAVGKFIQDYNNQKVKQAFSNGEIPDILLNLVLLGNSSNAIYSLQQTTGKLEKFTHSGEPIWSKGLNIPAQKNLFVQISNHNKKIGSDDIHRIFMYTRAMDAL